MQASTNKMIAMSNPECMVSESFRVLSTHIQPALHRDVKVILVTSASPGEGKTTVASNLAVTFAQEGKKVLLVDANLRMPRVHQLFLKDNARGLTDLLRHKGEVDESQIQSCSDRLFIIPSGMLYESPSELFAFENLNRILQALKSKFDIVLVDSPSVLSMADASRLAESCDGVLLVVHAKLGKKRIVKQAVSRLKFLKAHIVGTVFNESKHDNHSKDFNYYRASR